MRNPLLRLFTILSFAAIMGCRAAPVQVERPDPRPLGAEFSLPDYLVPNLPAADAPTGEITLRDALLAGLRNCPELASYSMEIRALEADALQAGLPPNPNLSVESENILGSSSELHGLRGAETTIQLAQLIELGGKRAARRKVAELDGELAAWDFEAKRLEVYSNIHAAFMDVLAAQAILELAENQVESANAIKEMVRQLVESGKISPIEETRADLELSDRLVERDRARRHLAGVRRQLALSWGDAVAGFDRAVGALARMAPAPAWETLVEMAKQNPSVARWTSEMARRRADLDLERAKRAPNVTVAAGVRHFNESDDHAFVVGLSIPLQVFNRNQGAVEAAEIRLAKGEREKEAQKRLVLRALAAAHREMTEAEAGAARIRDDSMAAADEILTAITEGYRMGKFGLHEVLEAQSAQFDVKKAYLAALGEYHKARVQLEGLLGQSLTSASENQKDLKE